MRKPYPLPNHLQQSAFTLEDGRKAGLSRSRLSNDTVVRTSRSIRSPKHAELDFPGRLRPYTRINERSCASHASAPIIWDFPDSDGGYPEEPIHLTRPSGAARIRRDNIVCHRSQVYPDEVEQLDGIFLTSRARTWLDLAEGSDLDLLVVIADHLIRIPRPRFENRRKPYCTLDELALLIGRHPGKSGIWLARQALDLARVGADSAPETRLRLALGRAGLPEPLLNCPIVDDSGKEWHSPDMSYPKYRLAIEYQGEPHTQPLQVRRDIRRAENVAAAGWDEIRISGDHMLHGAREAVAKIRTGLIEKGWDGRAA
ncbi:hypothetical protein [Arthrobacter mangrovi]|uniref:DUF559 domain-containing protein n=1 Tax=Arthrobacter mangrovi TaxID=2966350 RepID=A0ABQ5MVW0_9MICC|nr:hypothetical protein [Arthrobacter mangrovi]GLB67930.1 hypothetical protein AHIS1636_23710 [Arthrobacter mangrovi]